VIAGALVHPLFIRITFSAASCRVSASWATLRARVEEWPMRSVPLILMVAMAIVLSGCAVVRTTAAVTGAVVSTTAVVAGAAVRGTARAVGSIGADDEEQPEQPEN
jgi:hypothetical protein